MEDNKKALYTNHSGGAVGADYEWARQGEPYGVVSRHYWHRRRTPYGNVEISEADFDEGCRHVMQANRRLCRRPERYMDLLARDWCQVKYSDAVFAIAHLDGDTVHGGTGWAVQMAIDAGKPVWLFDQAFGHWFTFENGRWVGCGIPLLTPDFAGIGSRNITPGGIRAIGAVYRKTFQSKELITLLDGRTLQGYPKNEPDSQVDNGMRLDTTGEFLAVGRRRRSAPKPVSPEQQAAKKFFTDHAFFFLEHSERILSDSRMFLAPVPVQSGMAYTGTGGFHRPTLGIYIEWWLNCPLAVVESKNGRWLVYHIAGSPLSGANHCGFVNPKGKCKCESFAGRFFDLWRPFVDINRRYDEAKQHLEAYSLEEVVKLLEADADLH